MLSSGIAAVDAITGGFPRGCLTEICGPASSGKTSLVIATIAVATRRAETCVLIDASDSFDPASGAAAGLDFSKLLWIRCGGHKMSPHARAGTPAPPNSIFMKARTPLRLRSEFVTFLEPPKISAANNIVTPTKWSKNQKSHKLSGQASPTFKLEQVLKTTDLILQSGGFGLVVLDLAGIPETFSRRIPLASWFRFQRVIEPAKTALLVVSESPRTQSCAGLVIKLCSKPSAVSYQPSGKPTHAQILEGMRLQAEVVRSRLERRPMQSVTAAFETQAVRAR
jgi:hypothetical protein